MILVDPLGQGLPDLRINKEELSEAAARQLFEKFRTAAELGSEYAMCVCSRLCRSGVGVELSATESMHWAARAALADFPPGLFERGECLELGVGSQKDVDAALRDYKRSAELGYSFAAYRLALLFHLGDLVPRDDELALKWMLRAEGLGFSAAASDLAIWYETGDGVERSPGEALNWYQKAADRGDPSALMRLGAAYMTGDLGLECDQELGDRYMIRADARLRELALAPGQSPAQDPSRKA